MGFSISLTGVNFPPLSCRLWQIAESYLWIGQKRYFVRKVSNKTLKLTLSDPESANYWDYLKRAIKIASFIIPLLLLLALMVCFYYRSRYQIQMCSSPSPISTFPSVNEMSYSEVDIAFKALNDACQTHTPSKLQEQIASIKKPSKIILRNCYDHHSFYNRLTSISDGLRKRINAEPGNYSLEKTKSVWKKFLKEVESTTTIIYSDTLKVKLDTSHAQNWLKSKKIYQIYAEEASIDNLSEKDIQSMIDVKNECFHNEGSTHSKINFDKHKQELYAYWQNHLLFIARDAQDQNKIVGMVGFNPKTLEIHTLGRKAVYAKSKMQTLLFNAIFANTPSVKTHCLYVRKNNPAVALYEKMGFKKVYTFTSYFKNPTDDCYYMLRLAKHLKSKQKEFIQYPKTLLTLPRVHIA